MKSALLYSIIILVLSGCSLKSESTADQDIRLSLMVGRDNAVMPFLDVGTATQSVNRILIIPFQKLNVNLPDSDSANFIPAWNFIRQYDIDDFPVNSLEIGLPESFTYKVYILGYNRNDYDYHQPMASTNRFDITSQPASVTLAGFRLYPKVSTDIPEFFTCICTASVNGVSAGNVFTLTRNSNITLKGKLQRIVSGLGVYIKNIPAFVNSISLSAGDLVKSIKICTNQPDLVQSAGDGENRVIRELIPQNGTVRFNEFLLPTGITNKTRFYLNVTYGAQNTRYTINVPDSEVSLSQQIILQPNQAVTVSGDFSLTGISFSIDYTINLDDNKWDGLQ